MEYVKSEAARSTAGKIRRAVTALDAASDYLERLNADDIVLDDRYRERIAVVLDDAGSALERTRHALAAVLSPAQMHTRLIHEHVDKAPPLTDEIKEKLRPLLDLSGEPYLSRESYRRPGRS